jgi:DNA-binding MarR family transcriptional regulator
MVRKSPAARSVQSSVGLNPAQYRALANFRYALRTFLAFSEGATRGAGLTSQQYQALLAIKAHPGGEVLIRDLAAQMLLKHNNTVQLVDRLVDAKLVRREQSKGDKRAVVLALTAKGEAKVAHLAPLHLRELAVRRRQLADISKLAGEIAGG